MSNVAIFGESIKYTVFKRVGSFHAAVEEICYMGVFLRFGDAQLADAV